MKEKRQRKPMPLRTHVLLVLVLFVLAVGAVVVLGLWESIAVTSRMNTEINGYYRVNAFVNDFLQADHCLNQYWNDLTGSRDELEQYHRHMQAARGQMDSMARTRHAVGSQQYLWTNALDAMFRSYQEQCNLVQVRLQYGDRDGAMTYYYSGVKVASGYVQQYSQKLLEHQLAAGQSFFRQTRAINQMLWMVQGGFLVLAVAVGVVLLRTLLHLLRPMQALADASRAITNQDFTQPDLPEERNDEVGRMTRAFNQMKHSMLHSMQTLQEKNEMEARLHKKEMEALEMERLLGEAKLAQLRSQINPHFLFNTLNVINRMARTEQAPRTRTLVLSLAHLLRYTLDSDADQVTLSREAHIIDEYFTLYKTRFGDRVNLEWQIDPDLRLADVMVPSFILQPLVENAFKYGISPKIDGGLVTIRVRHRGDWLTISVSDNGVGMSPETLAELRSQMRECSPRPGHIGIYNVVARLKLTDPRCRMRAWSQRGQGTCIALRLPYCAVDAEELEKEERIDAESTDRG